MITPQAPTKTAIEYNEADAKHEYDEAEKTTSNKSQLDINPAKAPVPKSKPSSPRPRF